MKRILLVDDEESITFALRRYFVREGYAVDCVGSSEEAQHCLQAWPYSAAIVDVDLRGIGPSGDGLRLARFIRKHAPSTVVIVLTACSSEETERRAREAGVHSFLHKPARLALIADVARSLICDQA